MQNPYQDNSAQLRQSVYGMPIYARGGQEQAQGGGQDQAMQMIQKIMQMLQQGADPKQIMQQLVQMGIPQEQAQQLIQMAMQQVQGGSGEGQEQSPQDMQQDAQQMQQDPNQPIQ